MVNYKGLSQGGKDFPPVTLTSYLPGTKSSVTDPQQANGWVEIQMAELGGQILRNIWETLEVKKIQKLTAMLYKVMCLFGTKNEINMRNQEEQFSQETCSSDY